MNWACLFMMFLITFWQIFLKAFLLLVINVIFKKLRKSALSNILAEKRIGRGEKKATGVVFWSSLPGMLALRVSRPFCGLSHDFCRCPAGGDASRYKLLPRHFIGYGDFVARDVAPVPNDGAVKRVGSLSTSTLGILFRGCPLPLLTLNS